MGFLDKLKKKAQDAVNQVQQATTATQTPQTSPAPEQYAQGTSDEEIHMPGSIEREGGWDGPTFAHDGDSFPLPTWAQGISAEQFYLEMEKIKDRLMNADEEEGLERMVDEDGDELDPEEVLLITKLGFRSTHHYEGLRRWGNLKYATEAGEAGTIEQLTNYDLRMITAARQTLIGQQAGGMTSAGGGSGQLDPVEGVSVEQWAQIQAALASGGDLGSLLASAGLDQPKWDRVSNEWNARMASDHTATIATVYGNAFSGAAQGQFGNQAAHAAGVGVAGNLGQEPVPFERYVEIESAVSAAANRGEDPSAALQSFGLSPLDWSNIGAWWSQRIMQEGVTYAARYHELKEHFDAKYGA